MERPSVNSSIVWFYYDGLVEAARFYGDVLGLELVVDETWARIYKLSHGSFVGLVDATEGGGHCQLRDESAVLLTIVVDDVDAWFSYLTDAGAAIDGSVRVMESINVKCFFLEDPGGYSVEVQAFTAARNAEKFRS